MTKKEATELLPIIKAFSEGKQIQFLFDVWKDVDEIGIREFLENPELYRIKPEPKYRPFANAEECWQELLKHEPFGWVKDKDGNRVLITSVNDNAFGIALNGKTTWSLQGIKGSFTFTDGTPFGVKEE